jgi:hypothetical protein
MLLGFLLKGPCVVPFNDCPYAIKTPAFNPWKKSRVGAGQGLSREAATV